MPVKPIESFAEFQQLFEGDRTIVIDFWATWCGPCRAISPVFERLAEQSSSAIDFYKVDVDAQEQIAQECGVRAMPTFMVFRAGDKLGEVTGANPAGLEALIKKHSE
ncbi:hypothetical protein JCM3775_000819 [Rhodotorula graminis]